MLTAENRANLEKLATYLEGLPADYRHFEMNAYVVGRISDAAEEHYARHNGGVQTCGTAACAVGHGPAAGILVPPDYIDEDEGVDWAGYADIFSGKGVGEYFWLFEAGWSGSDNSHYGAAARIRYLLDNGAAPPDFDYPRAGWLPLYAPYRIDAKAQADG